MEKTLKIEGMTCMHCVGAVTKALQSVDGVKEVKIDLKKKTAVVTIDGNIVTDEQLQFAVTEAGYQVR